MSEPTRECEAVVAPGLCKQRPPNTSNSLTGDGRRNSGTGVLGMASPTEEFFDEISRRGHEPLLQKATGTVRFEMVQGVCTEHWYVTVDKGDLTVSRENLEADGVVRAGRELFDRVASGEASLMTALLRGEASAEGNLSVLVLFARLLPGPQGPRGQRLATSGGWL
jgi:hypothetical protein